MYLCRHDKLVRYTCGLHTRDHSKCTARHIPDEVVNNEVLRVIHAHINVYTDNVNIIRRINGRKQNQNKFAFFGKEIGRAQREMEKSSSLRNSLYEDYSAGIIDAEQYLQFKKECEEKEAAYKNQLEELYV